MTPKDKALDLVGNAYNSLIISLLHKDCEGDYAVASGQMTVDSAKQCALIAVNREIESFMLINLRCTFDDYMKPILEEKISELQQIKTEIENL